jgi:transposase
MIPIASGERERIATGHTDVRRSMNLLAFPPGGDLYVFRILWHDGFGTCRSNKRR